MSSSSLDSAAYLRRIDHPRVVSPTVDALASLHRAHMLAVPFENLDIHLGRPIVLDHDRLFEKVVTRRRGGFCYELNGLFAALLRALGFDVTLISARVGGPDSLGPEHDHLALVIALEERWLADVGFGDSFLEPLRLDHRGDQIQGDRAFRVREEPGRLWLDDRRPGGDFEPSYAFTLEPHRLDDFAAMCRFHQTSPESHFTQKRICSRPTADGRLTLRDRGFIVTRGAAKTEIALASDVEVAGTLERHFGIVP